MSAQEETVREDPFDGPASLTDRVADPDGPRQYELGAALGAGGMGDVYRAIDPALGRRVAFKRLRGADPERQARFLREARITARLSHPNIVPVHELATDAEGHPYYTMKEIEGRTLTEVIEAADRPLASLLQIFLKVCDAVGFAHSRGVIHRDLKPDNVMVGAFGEVLVVDWGLAAPIGAQEAPSEQAGSTDPTRTREGTILGTPCFMPPEQAEGRVAALDARSDVYALGAILYQMLTGEPPYTGGSVEEVLAQARRGRPAPPSARAPERRIPWDLEAAVLRAMAPTPAERYGSARELRDDVEAFLAGGRLAAAEYSAWQALGKWARRHWVGVTAGGLVLLAGLVALTGILIQRQEAFRQRDLARRREREALRASARADREAREAAEALGRARVNRSDAYAQAAEVAWSSGDTVAARLLAARSLELAENAPARSVLFDQSLSHPPRLAAILRGHGEALRCGQLSPDGDRVLTGSRDGTARLWDARTGLPLSVLPGPGGWIWAVAFSPDGRRVAVAAGKHPVQLHAMGGQLLRKLAGHSGRVWSVAFGPAGRRIATGGDDKTVRLWRADSGEPLRVLRGHAGLVRCVAFSPDGERLISVDETGAARIWELAGGRALHVLRAHERWAYAAAFSADGRRVVTGGGDALARIWDAQTGKQLAVLRGHRGVVSAVAFDPRGRFVATGSWDRSARLWRADGQPLATLVGHGDSVTAIGLSPRGERLLTASSDGTARLWHTAIPAPDGVLRGHQGPVRQVAFSADGQRLLTGSEDRTARVWQTASGEQQLLLPGHRDRVTVVGFSPDGGRVLTASDVGRTRIWHARSGKLLRELPQRRPFTGAAAFTADGRRVLTLDWVHCVTWDVASGEPVGRFRLGVSTLSKASFSPGGRVLIACDMSEARVWRTATGKQLSALRPPSVRATPGMMVDPVLGPDGRLALSGAGYHASLWDTATGEEVARLPHRGCSSGAIGPNGRVVTVGGSVLLWDLAGRRLLARLRGHSGLVHAAAFDRSGLIATAGKDHTARLWRWRDPRAVRIRLRVDSGRLVRELRVLGEPASDLPRRLLALKIQPAALRAVDWAGRYPTPAAIDAARDRILEATDPASAWLAVHRALGGRPRSGAYRLLVQEALETALAAPGARERPVLALVLAATGQPDRTRERARRLAADGVDHPVLRALAAGD